jgi:hypothetical protein
MEEMRSSETLVTAYKVEAPEDGGDFLLRNVDNQLQDYMASHPKRPQSTSSPPWGLQILVMCSTLSWWFLFNCVSFNDAVSSFVFVASEDSTISK